VTTGTTQLNVDASLAPNALTIVGNDGANSLIGSTAGDTINGNAGVDTITGGAGTDTMDGGAGDDIYLIAAQAHHSAAEIQDSSGTADEVRFTSATGGETLTIFAGDTGLETVRISDAAGVTTGTTQLNVDASLAPNALTIIGNDGANSLIGSTAGDTKRQRRRGHHHRRCRYRHDGWWCGRRYLPHRRASPP
jgi:Ca2+-binding RTX toxin-like protein